MDVEEIMKRSKQAADQANTNRAPRKNATKFASNTASYEKI
jgi:hypothetical protein